MFAVTKTQQYTVRTYITIAVLFTCSSTMAEEDNESAISSLIGSVVGGFTDNSKHLFGTGRFETLTATLAAAAREALF
jgi:outer membrane lipoprotein SlyB